jgi:sterol desaturase/sphingolipid hydroxylase (fatty acid hydroxylase superfamily)
VLASHPIHIIFHNQWNALGAATTHTGFDSITFKGIPILNLGAFHHQLHHRYYHCNYGNQYMPWDRWFGSDNDGTPEAVAKMRESRPVRNFLKTRLNSGRKGLLKGAGASSIGRRPLAH